MANEALFIGWGEIVRGRERKAMDVFNGSMQYYGQLQQDGKIESFDAYVLDRHGGDLLGFTLVHGRPEQLDELRRSPEFQLRMVRAATVVDRLGVADAYSGEALGRLMSRFEQVTDELGK